MMRRWAGGLALICCAASGPVMAQSAPDAGLSVEATTDYRERGLSWSRGAPTVAASGYLALDRVSVTAQAVGLRDSLRGGGADAAVTLGARYSGRGALRLSGGIAYRLFPTRAGFHYWEADVHADYDLGPATIGAGAAYAPSQSAIGGDNLYIDAGATLAVPGTPFSVKAGIGHSSGDTDDRLRSVRLRPGGSYTDYRIGMDYQAGPYALGLRYTDTSIDDDLIPPGYTDRHISSRVSAFVRLDL